MGSNLCFGSTRDSHFSENRPSSKWAIPIWQMLASFAFAVSTSSAMNFMVVSAYHARRTKSRPAWYNARRTKSQQRSENMKKQNLGFLTVGLVVGLLIGGIYSQTSAIAANVQGRGKLVHICTDASWVYRAFEDGRVEVTRLRDPDRAGSTIGLGGQWSQLGI